MSERDMDLAKRAVACKGWRWMAGMRASGWDTSEYDSTGHDYETSARRSDGEAEWPPHGDWFVPGIPDLTDPATLGCMLALVRDAWAAPYAYVEPGNYWTAWRDGGGDELGSGHSEAGALVAALEAAP